MNIKIKPRGIDISHWNFNVDKDIDLELFKQYYSFILVKATEGTKILDSRFHQIWNGAKSAGVPRGAYHYFKFRTASYTKQQAFWFWDNISNDPGEIEPWGDFEERDAKDFSIGQRRDWVQKWLINMTKASGIEDIGVYTSPGWWNAYIANATNGNTDIPRLMNPGRPRPLWVANWYVPQPDLPYDWKKRYGNDGWLFWQDTNKENGIPAGIPDSTIDGDWFNGTYADFNTRYGTSISPPEQTPEPIPTPDPEAEIIEIAYLPGDTTLRVRNAPWGDTKAYTWNGEQFKVIGTLGENVNPEKYWIKLAGDPVSSNPYADLFVASWYTKKIA